MLFKIITIRMNLQNGLIVFFFNNFKEFLMIIGFITFLIYLMKKLKFLIINIYLFINNFIISKNANKLIQDRNKLVKSFVNKYKQSMSCEKIDNITYLSAKELLDKIHKREISSYDATLAYSLKSATLGISMCLVAEVRYEEALEEAKKADTLLDEYCINKDLKLKIPPFLGLPMTVKNVQRIAGLTTNIGCKYLCKNKADFDSDAIEVLKSKGVIIYCTTNTPQLLLSLESSNNVYGNCQNPWDRLRTSGGSSGGCAGLVASYSSPISLCGDIGGSTRAPAHFTGLYGVKPSYNRYTLKNQVYPTGENNTGFKTWQASPGFLARSFDDIILYCRYLYGSYSKDFYFPQIKFNEEKFNNGIYSSYDQTNELDSFKSFNLSKLNFEKSSNYLKEYNKKYSALKRKKVKFGIVKGFEFVEPFEEYKKSIDILKNELLKQEFEVVDFNVNEYFSLLTKGLSNLMYSAKYLYLVLRGESIYYYYSYFNKGFYSRIYCYIMEKIYKFIGKDRLAIEYNIFSKDLSNSLNYMKCVKEIDDEKDKFYNFCIKNEIDALIMPTLPDPAGYIDNYQNQYISVIYTILANILNLSACSIPIKTIEDTTYKSKHNDYYKECINKSMKSSKGLPYGIQVLTMPYEDERCLRLSQEIDKIFKFNESKERDRLKDMLSYYRKNLN